MKTMLFKYLTAICLFLTGLPLMAASGIVIDITKLGVSGDGTTLNTTSIQKVIDDCASNGGGIVSFPAGRYLIGTIQIKSNVTLRLEKGSTLLGSTNADDYRNLDPFIPGGLAVPTPMGHALIVAVDASNVGIEGSGIVDGQSPLLKMKQNPYAMRPFLVRWVRCTNVTVKDVHLTNPGAWTLNFFQSKDVAVDGVTIRSRDLGMANNDGIDIDSSENVRVRNCDVISGDDALVIKATRATKPSRDIGVSDCNLSSSCNAIKLGTESIGGFENISVSNSQITNTKMAGIALYEVDGADLHNVMINDITMDGVIVPISIRLGSRLQTFRGGDQARPTPGKLHNVTIKNVSAKNIAMIGMLINGVPGFPVEDISLENIQLELPGGGSVEDAKVQLPEKEKAYPEFGMFGKTMPVYGIYARHVLGIHFSNVRTNLAAFDARPEKVFIDVEGVTPADFAPPPISSSTEDAAPLRNPDGRLTTSPPSAVVGAAEITPDLLILTPKPGPAPQINGPRTYGCRPGNPFLYRIPCTGERPIKFSAEHLPETLSLDAATGIVTGVAPAKGRYEMTFKAENSYGVATRAFKVVAGDRLALTPPMGWNSWYIYYNRVSESAMRKAADQMIVTGMADFGYQYVNNDDCWNVMPQPKNADFDGPTRDASGRLLPNKRYPDITGMVDYIHSKGLKAGIYSSPGPLTCGGFAGSWQHEKDDATTFADWGFDFLKYDWCSYDVVATGGDPLAKNLPLWNKKVNDVAAAKLPYELMSAFLRKQRRDMVFNICQYGLMEVWKWGGEVGNCWRTTDDLGLERNASLPGFYSIAFSNARHWEYAQPGAWNDPDYILIGWIGDARRMGEGRKTTLTPHEQYSYMSLWSLMAAPLIFSGDMGKMDAFTLNVLCNAEVIEVDQDALGRQAKPLRQTDEEYVLVKELEDGSKAVGLFNLTMQPRKVSVTWKELGIQGEQRVRDLWRQKDVGVMANEYAETIPPHGVALFRVKPQQ